MAVLKDAQSQKAAYLTWITTAGAFGQLYFDTVMSETHESTIQVTEHPTEKGSPISDNAFMDNPRVTLGVFVSNEPIEAPLTEGAMTTVALNVQTYQPPLSATPGALFATLSSGISSVVNSLLGRNGAQSPVQATVLQFTNNTNYVEQAFNQLKTLQENFQLVNVITTSRQYPNMIVERVSMPRDASVGSGANISIELRGLRIVTTQIVPAPASAEQRGQKTVKKGPQPPKEQPDYSKSILKNAALAAAAKGGTLNIDQTADNMQP